MSFIQEGIYFIVSALNGNPVLDLEGGNNPIANIIAYHSHGGKNQQWKVVRLARDEYSFQSVYGGTWITAPEDGNVAQLSTSRYDPIYNRQTRWKIVPTGNGYSVRSVLNTDKAVDVEGANTKDLTPILLYGFHGGSNQIWNFKNVN